MEYLLLPSDAPVVAFRNNPEATGLSLHRLAILTGANLETAAPDWTGNIMDILPGDDALKQNFPLCLSGFRDYGLQTRIRQADPDGASWEACLAVNPDVWRADDDVFLVMAYHMAVVCGMFLETLCGRKAALLHGALLETPRGGVILCGCGGVGKSTTARRWTECGGGTCPADDMMLLSWEDGRQLTVRPLPTWSACREKGLDGLCFNVSKAYPVVSVLALTRAESQEEIRPISSADFFCQVYNSLFFHVKGIVHSLPANLRARFLTGVRDGADFIAAHYQPRGLFAHLDGRLLKTMEEFL